MGCQPYCVRQGVFSFISGIYAAVVEDVDDVLGRVK